MLQQYGDAAFVIPEGTPARPGVPAFPIMDSRGCFDCNMAKAAYQRLSQQMGKFGQPRAYKSRLRHGRADLVVSALYRANPDDLENACNWSIAAAERLKVRS